METIIKTLNIVEHILFVALCSLPLFMLILDGLAKS